MLAPSMKFTNETVKEEVWSQLKLLLETDNIKRECFSYLKKNLMTKDFMFGNEDKFVLCAENTNGESYLLFLTMLSKKGYAFLINNEFDFFQIPVAASKLVFTGSLFLTELVWKMNDNSQPLQVLFIHDIIAFASEKMTSKVSIFERLIQVRKYFDLEDMHIQGPEEAATAARMSKIICGGNSFGLCFRPKACFNMQMLAAIANSANQECQRASPKLPALGCQRSAMSACKPPASQNGRRYEVLLDLAHPCALATAPVLGRSMDFAAGQCARPLPGWLMLVSSFVRVAIVELPEPSKSDGGKNSIEF